MPNRIIRAGILTSEKINELSVEGEVFFRRLLSIVDDYGRTEAHAGLLRAALYPLRIDRVKEPMIKRMLAEVAKAKLIKLYESKGKHYLEVVNFGQQRRSASKFPSCDAPMIADATQEISGDTQKKADAHSVVVVSEDVVEGVVATAKRPRDLAEVISYAETISLSKLEAEKFHDHFSANGWKQGGKTTIKDWRAACRNWQRRTTEFGPSGNSGSDKKFIGGAPAVPFDPKLVNAHTGGVEVVS